MDDGARLMAASVLAAAFALTSTVAQAQSRAPTAQETAAVRNCATKNQDDPEKALQECVNKLVAGPCIDKFGATGAGDGQMADCYYIEAAIWDALLNENYKALLGTLDAGQTVKARAMQRDWIASRDSTCQFFDDKIQGTMAMPMIAECIASETARRAIQLKIFSGL
jgi:uncharacterized protein YecT (DUF1311 family)